MWIFDQALPLCSFVIHCYITMSPPLSFSTSFEVALRRIVKYSIYSYLIVEYTIISVLEGKSLRNWHSNFWKIRIQGTVKSSNQISAALWGTLTRLCSKENFREPFRLPGVLAWVPRPKRWSPKLKFGGALQAPKHFSWNFIKMFRSKIRKLFFALIIFSLKRKFACDKWLRSLGASPGKLPSISATKSVATTRGKTKRGDTAPKLLSFLNKSSCWKVIV